MHQLGLHASKVADANAVVLEAGHSRRQVGPVGPQRANRSQAAAAAIVGPGFSASRKALAASTAVAASVSPAIAGAGDAVGAGRSCGRWRGLRHGGRSGLRRCDSGSGPRRGRRCRDARGRRGLLRHRGFERFVAARGQHHGRQRRKNRSSNQPAEHPRAVFPHAETRSIESGVAHVGHIIRASVARSGTTRSGTASARRVPPPRFGRFTQTLAIPSWLAGAMS